MGGQVVRTPGQAKAININQTSKLVEAPRLVCDLQLE